MAKNEVEKSEASSSASSDDLIKDAENRDKKLKKSEAAARNKTVPVVEQKLSNGVESQESDESKHLKTRTALLLLLTIFAVSLGALLFVYYSFPHLEK